MKKGMLALMALVLLICLSACAARNESTFNGSILANEDQYILEYQMMNQTETQSFEMAKGDRISVEVVSDAGVLDVMIQKGDDEPVYQGHQLPTGSFEITVHEAGSYAITVTGIKAKGSIRFIKRAAE